MAAKKPRAKKPAKQPAKQPPAKEAGERCWLVKSEPDVYSIEDLERDRATCWDGVRNYEARNTLRDAMQVGDGVLFYHSNAAPLAVVGIARVARAGYPDPSAFDPDSRYHDPASDPGRPTWFAVDLEFVARLPTPVTRAAMLAEPELAGMVLLQRGSRLSVQPVEPAQWRKVLAMGGVARPR